MGRINEVRQTVESDGFIVGAEAKTASPRLVQVYGELGVDFVWIDLEHTGPSPYDAEALEELARAAMVGDTQLLVRIPSGANPAQIRKVISSGIRNILVSRIETAADARRAVRAARIVHDGEPGERGISSGAVNNWSYPDFNDADFVPREDANVFVGLMMEQEAAVENADEILAVPDVGFVYIGPGDLSVSLGHPLELDHPEVTSSIERIREACEDAGVPYGRSVLNNDVSHARSMIADGHQILRFGSEIYAARRFFGERLDELGDE